MSKPDFDTTPEVMSGITIDPPGAHDLDDALWLREDALTLFIPDMSAIPLHDPIEQSAGERGFTRYFAQGRNAPMLPTVLSANHLSLLPLQPRRAIALHIRLDANYDVADMQVERGMLRSHAQLTYADVPAILSHDNHAHVALRPMLARMTEIGLELLRKRRERGALAFYDLKQALAMGEEGQVRALKPHEANAGYVLVQEMMLLANRAVAEWLLAANIPALYRNHRAALAAPPRESLLSDIQQMLTHPQMFDMQTARQRLHLLMGRARYSPVVEGHYALNLPCYTHVTSPLRRYADLVNNRVINELISARQQNRAPVAPYGMEELTATGDHIHALILEQEKSRLEHFRAKAEQAARAHIETTPRAIAGLSGAEFERILKVSAQETNPSDAALEGARLRLNRQAIRERELFLILYETPADNEAWSALRQDAVAFLITHPYHAVSLLAMGVDLLGWPETEYQPGVEQTLPTCRARQRGANGLLETEVFRAPGKKAAQQAAAVALCHLLCGAAPPVPQPAPLPVAPVKNSPSPEAQETVAIQAVEKIPVADVDTAAEGSAISASTPSEAKSTTVNMDWESIAAPIQAGSWIAALNLACRQTKQHKPRLLFTANKQKGAQTLPQWTCAAQLTWNGATYATQASAATKQVARRQVSRQLLSAICPEQLMSTSPQEDADTTSSDHEDEADCEDEPT